MIFRTRLLVPGSSWDPASLSLSPDPPEGAEVLARHRTGWTAKLDIPPFGASVLKVYHYPGLETLRGAFRNTFLAPSRAAREAETLLWLRRMDLGAPEPIAFGEERLLGWLRRAWILTRFLDASDLEALVRRGLPGGPSPARALGAWLGKAHALGLEDRIHRTGYVGPAGVSAALLAADLCLLPYRDGVSFRRGTLHACLTHGRAIVTTQPALDLPRVRDGENMLLVPPRDHSAMADAVMRLVTDPALRARLEAGASALAAEFSWEHIARRTAALFGRLT